MNTVQDVSRILRRKCPPEKDIVESSRHLKDHTDSLWLMEGEDDPNEDHHGWSSSNENSTTGHKRRKVSAAVFRGNLPHSNDQHQPTRAERAAFFESTTIKNGATLSYPGGRGFTSAAAQLRCITEDGYDIRQTQSSRERARLLSSRLGALHGNASADLGHKLKDKSNLLSLWGSKSTQNNLFDSNANYCREPKGYCSAGAQPHKDQVLPKGEPRKHTSSMHDQPQVIHKKNPLNIIPPGLANHKVYSRSHQIRHGANDDDRPRKHYLFLSSSPPPTNDRATQQVNSQNDVGGTGCTQAILEKNGSEGETSGGNIRPASTFHTTSVAEVRAGANHSKKTLGIRRSMTGWSGRGNQRFSIPGKASNGAGI